MERPPFRYEIEVGQTAGSGLDFQHCNVVDLTRPAGGEGEGEGFVYVYSGTFAECDAWLDAHPGIIHAATGVGQ